MGIVVLAGIVASNPVASYVLDDDWASGEEPFNIYVDTGSFGSLNGVSLSSTEAMFWMGFVIREWKVRSGANFSVNQFATINADCETNNDNYNVIGVATGTPLSVCGKATANACHLPRTNIWGNKVEDDICIIADPGEDWVVEQDDLDQTTVDLVTTMTHEVGHFLGLAHTTKTAVMNETQSISSSGRHLWGDDIEGVRAIYGSTGNQRKWRHWLGASGIVGSTAHSLGGTSNFQRTAGDVGGASSSSTHRYVVSTALTRAGDRQYFHRAQYPLSGSSTWTSVYFSTDSWTTAGIASNDQLGSAAKWVAVWPRKMNESESTCRFSGIRSTNAFASGNTAFTISGECSQLAPTVAYDPNSARFVLIWKAFKGQFYNTGSIYAATSTNGTTWTTPQNLGIHTLDAPHVDCHATTGCVLAYTRATSERPTVVTRKITVSASTGTITNGAWEEGLTYTMNGPVVAPYYLPDGAGNQYLILAQRPSGAEQANGSGDLYTHTDDVNPPEHYYWPSTGIFLDHPPGYAGRRTSDYGYVLTAD